MTDEQRSAPPREGYRAISTAPVFREEAEAAPRLVGHFARFNTFNEIDSAVEGRFLERITPGAFRKTFNDQGDRIRVLFQHGRDPDLGDKPIAAPRELREDEVGPYYEAELLDGLPPLVLDGLRKGQYGVSYRFQVVREDWDPSPPKSDTNPRRLPERTIREARVFEFGPVTFPADAGADVMVRSLSDQMTPPAEVRATDPAPEAPSLDAEAIEPHLEPERRDDPVEVVTIQQEETTPVADQYVTREEKASRVTELRESLAQQATQYPGVLPTDAQARWDADSAELENLERDIAAWDARQSRLAEFAAKAESTRSGVYSPPTIVRKVDDIYDVAQIRAESRTEADFASRLRDNAMRSVETTRFPHPSGSQDEIREDIAHLLDYKDSPDKEIARRILVDRQPVLPPRVQRVPRDRAPARVPRTARGRRGRHGRICRPVRLRPDLHPHRRVHPDQPVSPGVPRRADHRDRHVAGSLRRSRDGRLRGRGGDDGRLGPDARPARGHRPPRLDAHRLLDRDGPGPCRPRRGDGLPHR